MLESICWVCAKQVALVGMTWDGYGGACGGRIYFVLRSFIIIFTLNKAA